MLGRREGTTHGREGTACIVRRAHAKINLCLEVLGRRTDGLHEIATVMQTVSLGDRLFFTSSDGLTLRCRGMAATPSNLILRAAELLRQRTGTRQGCAVVCEKAIPVGAGLGGGSADAAATLLALNQLWGTGLGSAELAMVAGEVGADVPFFLRGGTALATGTGRTVEALPPAPRHWVVLAGRPDSSGDKTARLYESLEPGDFLEGFITEAQCVALRQRRIDYGAIRSSFWRAAADRWPALAPAGEELLAAGALAMSLTGSGPLVFGLFASRQNALRALMAVRAHGIVARLARFVEATDPDPLGGATGGTP